jgi:phage tail tape-measure protein
VADEPTLGEVQRRMEQGFIDLKDDMRELGGRLDSKVDQKVYDLRHEALMARVTTLETLREKDAEKIVATRRWLVGAVIVPLIGILLPVIILLAKGT